MQLPTINSEEPKNLRLNIPQDFVARMTEIELSLKQGALAATLVACIPVLSRAQCSINFQASNQKFLS